MSVEGRVSGRITRVTRVNGGCAPARRGVPRLSGGAEADGGQREIHTEIHTYAVG